MRVTPIALAAVDLAEAVDAAQRDAELTHDDPTAAAASTALCTALLALRTGSDPLAAARVRTRDFPQLSAAVDLADRRDQTALAQLAAGPEAGACWTTLAVALRALTRIDDYESGVCWAIALGGDTDTNAAVAGALLGYRHGEGGIPPRWFQALGERERIESAAEGLLERAGKLPAAD